jgi:hypothetical protein
MLGSKTAAQQFKGRFGGFETLCWVLLPAVLLVAACSVTGIENNVGNDADASFDSQYDVFYAPSPAPPLAAPTVCATTSRSVDFQQWASATLGALPPENSNAYLAPTLYERQQFKAAAMALLVGDCTAARRLAGQSGFEIVELRDGPDRYYYLEPRRKAHSAPGFFVVRAHHQWQRQVVLEAPHPLFDQGTGIISARAFEHLGAGALALAGSHRCANIDFGSADGTTRVCNEGTHHPYRESDMAHAAESYFQAFHEAFHDAIPGGVAIQLHAFAQSDDDPMFITSDGTRHDSEDDGHLALLFKQELTYALESRWLEVYGTSCNEAGDPDSLCATTNVQGRYSNGVDSDEVGVRQSNRPSGRFLHIELGREPRMSNGFIDGTPVLQALEATIPELPTIGL